MGASLLQKSARESGEVVEIEIFCENHSAGIMVKSAIIMGLYIAQVTSKSK